MRRDKDSSQAKFIAGIDIGGTFTDVTLIDDTGEMRIAKAPTTPDDFSRGVIDALAEVSGSLGMPLQSMLARAEAVKHGTTVGTNALINRDGAKVGFITTRGFEDTTLIMRAIGRVAGLDEDELRHQSLITKPEPIVSRKWIRGVTERIDFKGEIIIPLNEAEAREAIRALVEDCGVQALAVSFLWSFVNPNHEKLMEKIIESIYPDIPATYSHKLAPVIREYARANTVIINAFLDETMKKYVSLLQSKLKQQGYLKPLLIMQANGGVVHPEEMTAIATVSSGPTGGMIASNLIAEHLGHDNVITTDMGGTSFDVGILSGRQWRFQRDPILERFHVSTPRVDVESIGAGGGTIAGVDLKSRRLVVGPKSAGAAPGPACYGQGGAEPTCTDADLVLGYLDPDYFLGGKIKLDPDRASAAIEQKVAKPLGLSTMEAAAGIHDILNAKMADLIRKKVVGTGYLPRQFVLYCFGGAGPVHACGFAHSLGIDRIFVFPTSSVFSSFGIAAADIIHTFTISSRHKMPAKPDALNGTFGFIESELLAKMKKEGFRGDGDVAFKRRAYMRYRKQVNDIDVEIPVKHYDEEGVREIIDLFEDRYEKLYGAGSGYREAGVELLSLSVDAIGKTVKPALKKYPSTAKGQTPKPRGRRKVFFTQPFKAYHDADIYYYDDFAPGHQIAGPSIVLTPITTIVIPPGARAGLDGYLNLEINLASAAYSRRQS